MLTIHVACFPATLAALSAPGLRNDGCSAVSVAGTALVRCVGVPVTDHARGRWLWGKSAPALPLAGRFRMLLHNQPHVTIAQQACSLVTHPALSGYPAVFD